MVKKIKRIKRNPFIFEMKFDVKNDVKRTKMRENPRLLLPPPKASRGRSHSAVIRHVVVVVLIVWLSIENNPPYQTNSIESLYKSATA